MRKIFLLLSGSFFLVSTRAQEPVDALKFSWNVPGGSARIQAVGGAMGSLGGDITALFVNPAGLAFYRTGDFILSPAFQSGNAKSTYLGRQERDQHNRFTWGATGFVVGGNGRNGKNSAFSIALNRTADFNSRYTYSGQNFSSSYSQKYLEEIGNTGNGNVVASEFPFGASLGFNTFWIDTVGGGSQGNFQFQSRSVPLIANGLLQQNTVHTKGGITEIAFGGAAQINNKLMIGGSLGVPLVYYEKDVEFIEADPTSDPNNKFDFARVNETMSTKGVGINLKAGLIYKPQEYWRLGLALHSPTFYSLTDMNDITVTTNTEGYKGEQFISTTDITGADHEFKYYFHNPYKVIGSISFVIRETEDVTRQRGFITADVEYVNHKASSYYTSEENSDDAFTKNYLKSLNTAIDNAFRGAFNYRVGGEIKFTTIMARLGAAYYSNPYKNIEGEKGSRLNLSGGLGYRNQGFFIDLTYVHAMTRDVNFAYRLQQSPNSIASIRQTTGNILATVGFKF
ncbi:MAG: aromatic hydrocarbon degradation protein [Flavisolibacter sp.]|jgi:hypothetical protein|nr:aromatic hydrocarbon degradation protein [Flavisolibacter sp.]